MARLKMNTLVGTPSTTQTPPFPFFHLPRELRDQIYHHLWINNIYEGPAVQFLYHNILIRGEYEINQHVDFRLRDCDWVRNKNGDPCLCPTPIWLHLNKMFALETLDQFYRRATFTPYSGWIGEYFWNSPWWAGSHLPTALRKYMFSPEKAQKLFLLTNALATIPSIPLDALEGQERTSMEQETRIRVDREDTFGEFLRLLHLGRCNSVKEVNINMLVLDKSRRSWFDKDSGFGPLELLAGLTKKVRFSLVIPFWELKQYGEKIVQVALMDCVKIGRRTVSAREEIEETMNMCVNEKVWEGVECWRMDIWVEPFCCDNQFGRVVSSCRTEIKPHRIASCSTSSK